MDLSEPWQKCWDLRFHAQGFTHYHEGGKTITYSVFKGFSKYTLTINLLQGELVMQQPHANAIMPKSSEHHDTKEDVPCERPVNKEGDRSVPLGICTVCMDNHINAKLSDCPHAFCEDCLTSVLTNYDGGSSSDSENEIAIVKAPCPECRVMFSGWDCLVL